MRILLGINTLDNAGAENFVLRLAKSFAQNEHCVFIFSLNKIRPDQLERVQNILANQFSKIELIDPVVPDKFTDFFLWKINRFFMLFGKKDFRSKAIIGLTKRKIRTRKPDIVNSHLFETDEFLASGINIPHVISMHGAYELYLHRSENNQDNANYINEKFISKAKKVIGNSKHVIYTADKNLEILNFIKENRQKRTKIYNGFEQVFTPKIRSKVNTIGLFARGLASKGWEELIEAFLIVSQKRPELSLHLIYTDTEFMTNLQIKYRSNHQIKFLGSYPSMEKPLEQIDLIVFPTYYSGESLPYTVIESLAAGIPVISTDIGEIPSMIRLDGIYAGEIVSLDHKSGQPDSNDLAKIIEKYLDDEALYQSLAINTQKVFEQFNIQQCTDQYIACFKEVLSEK